MKRVIGSAAVAATLVLCVVGDAQAQVGLYGGGGITLPTGEFDEVAESGFGVLGGLQFDYGGIFLGAEGGFSSNDHHRSDDKTNVFHALGFIGKSFANENGTGIYVWGGGGWVANQLEDGITGDEVNDNQFGLAGGVGFSFPLGDLVSGWVETRVVDTDIDNTNFGGIIAGLYVPLGGN